MARYIDADKFLKKNEPPMCPDDLYEALYEEPAADVEVVRHGEWIPIVMQDDYLEPPYCDTIKCSECGEEADVSFHNAKYCYMCGAKMDGGKDE